jgi:hypothetical protein
MSNIRSMPLAFLCAYVAAVAYAQQAPSTLGTVSVPVYHLSVKLNPDSHQILVHGTMTLHAPADSSQTVQLMMSKTMGKLTVEHIGPGKRCVRPSPSTGIHTVGWPPLASRLKGPSNGCRYLEHCLPNALEIHNAVELIKGCGRFSATTSRIALVVSICFHSIVEWHWYRPPKDS